MKELCEGRKCTERPYRSLERTELFLAKVVEGVRFHDWAISLFLNTLEIVLCYLFRHQLTRSRKVLSIIQTVLQNLLPFLKIYSLRLL